MILHVVPHGRGLRVEVVMMVVLRDRRPVLHTVLKAALAAAGRAAGPGGKHMLRSRSSTFKDFGVRVFTVTHSLEKEKYWLEPLNMDTL